MLFSADFVNLILYSLQQLGVMLGAGAETIVLVAYLLAIRDGAVDSQEERFARAVKRVLYTGLAFVFVSGVLITLVELTNRHSAVVLMPAYLFKILLILIVLVMTRFTRGNSLFEGVLEGFAGATWYALFIVHILAPVASWGQLAVLYVAWVVGFSACWVTLVFMMRGAKVAPVGFPSMKMKFTVPQFFKRAKEAGQKSAVASQRQTPEEKKISQPAPAMEQKKTDELTAPPRKEDSGLAAIHVMPKSWEELHKQNPSATRF